MQKKAGTPKKNSLEHGLCEQADRKTTSEREGKAFKLKSRILCPLRD
jgi:hypothetical protein